LASLEQFWQSDVSVVRPPDDATRLLRCIVDARLFGIHVGAVYDWYPRHPSSPAEKLLFGNAKISTTCRSREPQLGFVRPRDPQANRAKEHSRIETRKRYL
jgi:hypothetical protein